MSGFSKVSGFEHRPTPESRRCQGIVANFAWFDQQCANEGTSIYYPPDYPNGFPVCDEHNPLTPPSPNPESETKP